MFLEEKKIASTRAEFFQRDTCQVRPMGRCPSVPLDYLYNVIGLIELMFYYLDPFFSTYAPF